MHQVPQDEINAFRQAFLLAGGPIGAADAAINAGLAATLGEFRDKLAALAAIEDYIGESGQNAARNIRDLLAGEGEHDNDPRVQARAWGLEWAAEIDFHDSVCTGPGVPAGFTCSHPSHA